MSELYSTTTETSTETSEPAAETVGEHERERNDATGQHQDNAAIEASLDEADLPTRAESRAATWGPDAADDPDEDEADAEYDGDLEALLAENNDGLPTRAESRAATWGPDATSDEDDDQLAGEYDGDLSAITPGQDRHPAQQYPASADLTTDQNTDAGTSESTSVNGEQATETRSGTGPLTDKPHELDTADAPDASQTTDASSAEAPAGDRHQDTREDWPSQEDRDRWQDLYENYLKDAATSQKVGRDSGTNVIGDKPDRSPGDISDLPPTGEQLLHMESEEQSWKKKLSNEIHQEAGEITDVAGNWGDLGAQLFERPPVSTYTEVPSGHPDALLPEQHQVDGGQVTVAAFVIGLLAYEGAHRIKNKIGAWRGR
jgi:hypothetical protein